MVDRVLGDEDQTFIVSVRLPGEIVAKAREMAAKEKEEDSGITPLLPSMAETAQDIAVMDRMLAGFFWHEVDPCFAIRSNPRIQGTLKNGNESRAGRKRPG